MIKNKNKVILVLLIVLSLFTVTNVDALDADIKFKGSKSVSGVKYGNGATYNDSYFDAVVNGKTYPSYCIDPSYGLANGVMACEELTSGPMVWLVRNLPEDHFTAQLAVRMLAARLGLNKNVKGNGQFIVKYIQARDYENGYVTEKDVLIYEEYKALSPATQHLYSDDRIEEAYKLAREAMYGHENDSFESTTLKYSVASASGKEVTYSLSSEKNIPNISFTCTDCSIKSKSWNGTSGSITVTVDEGDCAFKINAYYSSDGVYKCDKPGQQAQVFHYSGVFEGQNNTTGTPTQTIPGTIDPTTGGEYYEKYCKGRCDQKTEFNIPTYCDDDAGEEITITAPTNVKSCILKGKDEAGNTYQSSVVTNNPYCSVYCKEDYKMTLPGAKYTYSGRYFELENTLVQGTRSCYVTGSQTGNDTEGIDLVQFKKDVVAKQENLIKEFNEYSRKKALYDNRNNATYKTTTESKDCNGATYYKYEIKNVPYDKYDYVCNESTGHCTIKKTTGTTSATWGETASAETKTDTKTSTTGNEPGYTCTVQADGTYSCTKTSCETKLEDHGNEPSNPSTSGITTAKNNLTATIDNLEDCYNWTNDYCFEPEITFDYKEQYKTDINYEKVSGSEKQSSNTTFGTTIDEQYNTNNSGSITSTVNYIGCTASGCTTDGNKAVNVSETVTYIKKEVTKSAEYNNNQAFQSNYPHGTIDTVTNPEDVKYNYSYLGAVFPIALKTDTGVYNWTLKFDNIGQYNDTTSCSSSSLGRLNKVGTAVGKVLEDEIGYVCVYVIDCDDCDYGCTCPENLPDGYSCVKKSKFVCEIVEPDPKCDDCDVYCVNCIFDGNDTYNYRTVSLSSINPNDRKMGSNWSSTKGKKTKSDIETNAENIYKEPEYSYTITPTQMKNIRDYNNQQGTYVAEDLEYHDAKINGITYSNVYGTSEFLNDNTKKYFTENKRNDDWTFWGEGNNEEINTNGSGPSWK